MVMLQPYFFSSWCLIGKLVRFKLILPMIHKCLRNKAFPTGLFIHLCVSYQSSKQRKYTTFSIKKMFYCH